MPEVEDDRDDDEAGPPARRESAEGTWAVLRFFRTRQRGEWWTVAAVTARGCDGCTWAREGERAEEGRSTGESERGPEGCVALPDAD